MRVWYVSATVDREEPLDPVQQDAQEFDLWFGTIGAGVESDLDMDHIPGEGVVGRLGHVPVVVEDDVLHILDCSRLPCRDEGRVGRRCRSDRRRSDVGGCNRRSGS
jgi:hypothetical protein